MTKERLPANQEPPKKVFSLKNLTKLQLTALLTLAFLIILLPVSLLLSSSKVKLFKRAYYPATDAGLSPAPTLVSSKSFGQAVKISDKNSYIEIPNTSLVPPYDLPPNPYFTIEAWVKPSVPSSVNSDSRTWYIATKSRGYRSGEYIPSYSLTFIFQNLGLGRIYYNYRFSVTGGESTNTCSQNSPISIESGFNAQKLEDVNKWTHVAGVIKNGYLSLYVDGKLASLPDNEFKFEGNLCNSTAPLLIGSGPEPNTNFPKNDATFQGEIDEVRFSNISRYSSDFTLPTEPFIEDMNTSGLWHLDGNANDARNSQPLNGRVVGNVLFIPSTITYSCPVGPQSITFENNCAPNSYYSSTFTCLDGFHGTNSNNNQCKPAGETLNEIIAVCQNHPFCPSPISITPTTIPVIPTSTAFPTPTLAPTSSPRPTSTSIPTSTPTISCSQLGTSVLDQQDGSTYTAQVLTANWGTGSPLTFIPTKKGKLDKIELFVSGKGNIQVRVDDSAGNIITDVVTLSINQAGKWTTFDFNIEPLLLVGKTYNVTFRAAYSNPAIYVHRGNNWAWGKKIYLKPCLN